MMQTGLTLYVDARCDLDDSKFVAVAILDLMVLFHVFFMMIIMLVVYAVVAKTVGVRSSKEELRILRPTANRQRHRVTAFLGTNNYLPLLTSSFVLIYILLYSGFIYGFGII